MEKESKFTGGLLGLIGINFLCALLNIISFSIAVPWTICMKERWYAKHTFIDGKQLTFDGTGAQLIGNWIKWILLTIVTFGIFGLWIRIKLEQWVVKHTHTC